MRKYTITFIAAIVLGACVKDTKTTPVTDPVPGSQTAPSVAFSFKAVVGSKDVISNTGWYTNSSKDSFTVTKLNYYISNIKLKKEDGTYFTETESYHLIRHVEGNTSFTIANVDEANYTSIEFLIGVDSLRNVSGAQTGALDPANLMFWDWSTGYIFYKLEGQYRTTSMTDRSEFAIHIGGFGGKYPCLQKCVIPFPSTLSAKKNGTGKIYFNTKVDEVFQTPNKIGLDVYYATPPDFAMFKSLSDNYRDMFVIDKIESQ